MESNLPDGDLELSELPKGRKMSENGYLSQEQIIDSSSDVQFATLPNDMDSYESTTDPSGVNQVQTLPAPSRRVSGILKNGSSFPRDVQLQDENQIQNPLFGSPMLSDQNQRTILNVEPESASNNHHSSVLNSEDTPTLKKKVSFQDNLVITSEESNYVSAVDILSPSNLEHIEEETDGSSEEDEVPTPHDNETAVAIAEDNTMEGTYDTLQSSKSTLSKGEVLTSRNSVELFQGRYSVDELEFRNRRSRTYSEAEVPTASTGHPLYSTGKKPGRDFRCLVCMTVSMVAIAFIGLIILGSLYGISQPSRVDDRQRRFSTQRIRFPRVNHNALRFVKNISEHHPFMELPILHHNSFRHVTKLLE
ncbi:hypothetical protein CAPTEDRAFT_185635 [Capitella teleta]|uniref:Uncharacterized protein n=1 Tax=Capitella teleta TaxID=283909 RepID=R7UB31_CAPTE|nr:hypothetical protein CAPTEDRAFT_185635 [Capitella teleta]|eukprot:ELU03570.1 hypothetical protein CAPTEDRAFT_185635 [Capitella teleta]